MHRIIEQIGKIQTQTTFKGLARVFSEVLAENNFCTKFSVATFNENEEFSLEAMEINGEMPQVGSSELASLSMHLKAIPQYEYNHGLIRLNLNGIDYAVMVADCSLAEKKCVAVWDFGDWNDETSIHLDLLVNAFQREAFWYRKLDKTQALLYRDDLTELFNYRYFEVALENEIRRAERFDLTFTLLFIDLDSFKPINDKFGHLAGSSVLKQVAFLIRDAVREVDIPIRYGGDEFVVLLLGADGSIGKTVAERIRSNIEKTSFVLDSGDRVKLTASIGVASYPENGTTKSVLVQLADESMYKSKKSGKNKVSTYDPSLETLSPFAKMIHE